MKQDKKSSHNKKAASNTSEQAFLLLDFWRSLFCALLPFGKFWCPLSKRRNCCLIVVLRKDQRSCTKFCCSFWKFKMTTTPSTMPPDLHMAVTHPSLSMNREKMIWKWPLKQYSLYVPTSKRSFSSRRQHRQAIQKAFLSMRTPACSGASLLEHLSLSLYRCSFAITPTNKTPCQDNNRRYKNRQEDSKGQQSRQT